LTATLKELWIKLKAVCLTLSLHLLPLLTVFSSGHLSGQEKDSVFWTHGGNWGSWLKITAHPGLAIRTACGDDSMLKNYPVSSTDWQLRNNYHEPMAVVWRVQFFNDTSGKNEMSGWMLEHLAAGEVSDGWNVEGGHCQARNFISVQVKCAVPEADQAKCYNSDGNPYPPRPDGAFNGDHKPTSSTAASPTLNGRSGGHGDTVPIANSQWTCVADLATICSAMAPTPTRDMWTLTFRDDGSFENVTSSFPYHTDGDTWKQQNGHISWFQEHYKHGILRDRVESDHEVRS
jgi:hypothetical protein